MNMRKLLAAFFFCGIAFTLSAQQPVAPPPKPAPDGPSLAATMQFIQTKVQERGRLNFAVYTHDNADGKDYVDQYSGEASNIVADPAACRISYHGNVKKNGAVLTDTDVAFSLHDVQDLVAELCRCRTPDLGAEIRSAHVSGCGAKSWKSSEWILFCR
jgi:hypothetical protein